MDDRASARLGARLDILLAAEALLACPGGAERFALELLEALAVRNRVRALVLGDPESVAAVARLATGIEVIAEPGPHHDGGPANWRLRRQRSDRMNTRLRRLLADDPADVVIGQLNAGAGALAAARHAGVPGVMLLAGYEALCAWAFAPGTQCRLASRCRACPRALALPEPERGELWHMRAGQDAALRHAACLIAPSYAMAAACQRVAGRSVRVAAPVAGAPAPVRSNPHGAIVVVSSVWSPAKGVQLLAPIAARLPDRQILIRAPNGLPDEHRWSLSRLANVTVSSERSGIAGALDRASLLLVPSQHPEPFGRVAFEAMAAGVPTLASGTGGLPEYVPARQLVRHFHDPDAWASAVRALEPASDWREARRRGMAAAKRVLGSDPCGQIEEWLRAAATASPAA